jgi:RNA polymerase sigma factor (sigma-70 family)
MDEPENNRRLATWFRQWRSPLRKFLRRKGAVPTADLDDAAQEVFFRLLRYDRSQIVKHPQAYLFKIASNVAAEWSIRARYTKPHHSRWLTDLLDDSHPEQEAVERRVKARIKEALLALPADQREMLRLHFFEGLGRAEIAERLGTTQRFVKRAFLKSYQQLREELDPELLGAMTHGPE